MAVTNYKFRDIKSYSSTEWLANNTKKYRSVFDEMEIAYVYCEVSLLNKHFDAKAWNLKMQLKCFDQNDNEICDLSCDRVIAPEENIIYVREGWGVKTPGTYWKAGSYRWEAIINGKIEATKDFYIENHGLVRDGFNPYFELQSARLYEAGSDESLHVNRKYYKSFSAINTRYVWLEASCKNLTRRSKDLPLEFVINFRTQSGYLKGTISKLFFIKSTEDNFKTTVGWGSDIIGTWTRGKYAAELVFMDHLVAVIPFEIGDDFVESSIEEIQIQSNWLNAGEIENAKESKKKTPVKPKNFDEVMAQLDGMIGLTNIKTKVREYSDYLRFVALRKDKGFEEDDKVNLHAIFKGNPGTGKTTVARLLGQIYKELGLLKKGHVHEVDRGDLVAEFIGQTAPKTKEAIKKAKDGILFIDEAYALARKDDDNKDFGKEAIEVLLKELSDSNDIAIICAGYPDEMDTFLDSNPGLRSRFNMTYDFADYIPQELSAIAEYAASDKGVIFSEKSKEALYKYLVDKYRSRDKFFGNARMVNSLVDEAKMNLGLRVMKTEKPENLTRKELSTIEPEDFEKILKSKNGALPDIPIDEELLKESLKKLKDMIGLTKVNEDIDEVVKLVRYYKKQGKDVRKTFSLHSVFSGNPGTGKTTVARILAQIYKALGILERGHLMECDRQSLVGGYVGQTAIKTTDVINRAMGGVLFIDEAYSLSDGGGSDYGREAVETLLKRMEDQRGEFIVIAAGYTQNMHKFMESNPGLKSRFDRTFDFEDFNGEELYKIAVNQLSSNNLKFDTLASEHIKKYINFLYDKRDKYFGNGRTVRKVIEESIRNQHLRLSELPKAKLTAKTVGTIIFEDVDEFSTDLNPGTPGGGIGFKL